MAVDEPEPDPVKEGGTELQGDAEYDEMIRLANAFFPSAMGLTFITEFPGNGLTIEARATVYESQTPSNPASKLREWRRRPLDIAPIVIQIDPEAARPTPLGTRAHWTLPLISAGTAAKNFKIEVDSCHSHPGLRVYMTETQDDSIRGDARVGMRADVDSNGLQ